MVLTIEDKLKICELVKQKVSKTIIMNNYNIGKSTINDICRKEADLQKFKSAKQELGVSSSVAKRAKVMKSGSFDKLDEALYIWLKQQRERGTQYWSHFNGKGFRALQAFVQNQRRQAFYC